MKALLVCTIALAGTSQALALESPKRLMIDELGINPHRDLDGQVPILPVLPAGRWGFATEDYVPADGFLGPAGGGQAFDFEGLYFWRTDTTAWVLLATGFRVLPARNFRDFPSAAQSPDSGVAGTDFTEGGLNRGFAGDIFFDTNADLVWDHAISLGAYQGANGRAGLGYGDLYLIDTTAGFNNRGYYRPGHVQGQPWLGVSAGELTNLDHSSERIWVREQFGEDMNGTAEWERRFLAAFEIDLTAFPQFGSDLFIHWTMECGNDEGNLFVPPPTPPRIPEPLTIFLVGIGGAAVLYRRKRRLARKP